MVLWRPDGTVEHAVESVALDFEGGIVDGYSSARPGTGPSVTLPT